MNRLLMTTLALLALVSSAAAQQSLGPEATQEPVAPQGDPPPGGRWPIEDGSFENGECDAGSSWTCITNQPDCGSWILDPLPAWGYPAYHGTYAAWLGGFCNGQPNSNAFCQEVFLGGCIGSSWLQWKWMGYVPNNDGNRMRVTVDGDVVFEKVLTIADHTYPMWGTLWIDVWGFWPDMHELCFEFEATTGANMLIDYIEASYSPTAVEPTSLSVVKSLY